MSDGPQDSNAPAETPVLINKLGLSSSGALRRAEYDLTRVRLQELQVRPVEGHFDLKHMQDIHRHVFQDVYESAGQLRTVGIWKDGNAFAAPERLRPVGLALFALLAADKHLRGLEKPDFVEGLANHYARMYALHPFREGNGRVTQTFISDLARQAGYVIDYTRVDKAVGRCGPNVLPRGKQPYAAGLSCDHQP